MRFFRFSAVLLPFVMAACGDSTGNDTGQLRVSMSASTSAANTGDAIAANELGVLTLSQVDSMFIRVTAVSALKQGADTAEASGGWVTLQLADSGGKRINLLNLPRTGGDSIGIARGDLKPGNYKNIRLQFDSTSSTIRLKQDVTIGTFAFLKNTSYPLRVPSGVIKIPAATLTVSEDSLSQVNLVFQLNSSIGTIVATGSGQLMMNPVIHTSK
jgi:hypothetical protein